MLTFQEYDRRKERLRAGLTEHRARGAPVALNKKTSNLFRDRRPSNKTKIDVSDFNHVISMDAENGLVEAEGMTTFEDLTDTTLKFGFMPAVVPEFKLITLGGAATGGAIESSSFREGLLHETIEEMDILLADGRCVTCTKNNEYRDLFFGFANSYGTLGYALRLKARLVKVKPYVKLEHRKYTDPDAYYAAMREYCESASHDFIDGTVFSGDELYITLGSFVSTAPGTSDYTYMQRYFHSIRRKQVDYLTVYAYIWRWDTDWFWCSKFFGAQNQLIRLLLGPKHLQSKTYLAIRRWNQKYKLSQSFGFLNKGKEGVVQDVQIPIDECASFLTELRRRIGIFPIWMCPTRAFNPEESYDLYSMDPQTLYINFGFWDYLDLDGKPKGHYDKIVEDLVSAHRGKKSLYSDSYYDEPTFWRLYNRQAYDRLKKKYDPDGVFLDLYEKCVLRK